MEVSTKNILLDHLTSGSEVNWDVNMKEVEFPSDMETDENVEMAEAYGKELEDVSKTHQRKYDVEIFRLCHRSISFQKKNSKLIYSTLKILKPSTYI